MYQFGWLGTVGYGPNKYQIIEGNPCKNFLKDKIHQPRMFLIASNSCWLSRRFTSRDAASVQLSVQLHMPIYGFPRAPSGMVRKIPWKPTRQTQHWKRGARAENSWWIADDWQVLERMKRNSWIWSTVQRRNTNINHWDWRYIKTGEDAWLLPCDVIIYESHTPIPKKYSTIPLPYLHTMILSSIPHSKDQCACVRKHNISNSLTHAHVPKAILHTTNIIHTRMTQLVDDGDTSLGQKPSEIFHSTWLLSWDKKQPAQFKPGRSVW